MVGNYFQFPKLSIVLKMYAAFFKTKIRSIVLVLRGKTLIALK